MGKPTQEDEIYELFDKLNNQYFDGTLPYIRILWCDSFGNGKYFKQWGDFIAIPGKRPYIRLSSKLCANPKDMAHTLYHEMVHFWLYDLGKPWGHTKAFKKKMDQFKMND